MNFVVRFLLLFSVSEGWTTLVRSEPQATYVWPLGNTTVNREVMIGLDATLPDDSSCFRFRQGYPRLPYDSFRLTGDNQSYVDINLNGNNTFKDISISIMVYPEGPPQGTLVNYLYKTGNIIKVSMLETYLFISFWDEYGVSVGTTAIPDVLLPDTWSHLVISREFLTGRIQVFHDGDLLEDLDDDFPNEIQLPSQGALRLGKSLDEPDDSFLGRMTCFQLFDKIITPDQIDGTISNCLPNSWNIKPEVKLERRYIGGEVQQCLSDGSEASRANCDVIGMRCLSGSGTWNNVLALHNWANSGLDTAYFGLASRDRVPANQNDHLLGIVSTEDKRVCLRLCMRVLGCRSFAVANEDASSTTCMLLDQKLTASVPRHGWRYYVMKT